MDFNGKVSVVTGASSGIGRQTALDLARAGASVCAVARREDRLRALVTELGRGSHSYFVCDVSKRAEVRKLSVHVDQTYRRCDILVNNAGFSGDHGGYKGSSSVENIESVMATNFFGAVYCTSELFHLLERAAPAHVVNVASIAGRMAVAGTSAYNASKFALVGWSEALHYELEPRRIHVSLVEPGLIPTEGFPQNEFVNHAVLQRVLGTPEQVSAAIVDAIQDKKMQRVVPRWYYLLQVPRVLAPPLVRTVQKSVVARFTSRRARSTDH